MNAWYHFVVRKTQTMWKQLAVSFSSHFVGRVNRAALRTEVTWYLGLKFIYWISVFSKLPSVAALCFKQTLAWNPICELVLGGGMEVLALRLGERMGRPAPRKHLDSLGQWQPPLVIGNSKSSPKQMWYGEETQAHGTVKTQPGQAAVLPSLASAVQGWPWSQQRGPLPWSQHTSHYLSSVNQANKPSLVQTLSLTNNS